jgi:hypothetical protein
MSELKNVALPNLHSNPFRDEVLFPLREARVLKLVASIAAEGFWEGVIARQTKPGNYEIAFGHHRVEAARRELGGTAKVPIIVRELTDDEMLRFMERENLSDGLGFYYTKVQVVRAAVIAFGAGKVTFPKADKKTRNDAIRVAPSFARGCVGELPHAYTVDSLAQFLGLVKSDGTADRDVETAVAVLEGMEAETLTREDVDVDVWCRWCVPL